MSSALRITDAQRRDRLVHRHLLAAASADPIVVTQALVALHSTDPASVYLSAAGRGCSQVGALDNALYADRSLVRMLGMRRTMFVVAADLAPVVHAAATRTIAARERNRLVGFIEQNALADDGKEFLERTEGATLAALLERGEAYGSELGAAVPGLRQTITIAGGSQSLTTRVLFLLAADGRIVRGRPKGSWLSSQYRWAPAPVPPPTASELPTAVAQVELARAYLAAYGPATLADLQWWTGWTAAESKRAVAGLATVAVELDGAVPAMVLADDVDPIPPRPASARLLPALDPSVMGWTGRAFYLEHPYRDPTSPTALFDRSGNPGPTVWWNGRIVGGWAQRNDGEIAVRLLEDVGAKARSSIENEAGRTAEFLGDVRVRPRFRTALERALVSSPD